MTGEIRRPVLQIITGSTRPSRIGPIVATWFTEIAKQCDSVAVEQVDLAEVDLPLLDEPVQPKVGVYSHEHTKAWSRIASRGQAYVFVVPEYNHGCNAATKNAIDFLFQEWAGKPVGFVSYGGHSGGARAVGQLMQVVEAVGMVPASENVSIVHVSGRITADRRFAPTSELDIAAKGLITALNEELYRASRGEPALKTS